jgi:tRNA nucleotidyltransferase (CCA-adding enzyme)
MSQVKTLLQSHPDWPAVETIYHSLVAKGYKAFLAGGCVRDALIGIQAVDLDIATNATPEQIENLFEKTVSVGKSFGVIRVLTNEADIEVATFRTDGSYTDGRRPDHVTFSSPQEDALRRDFTINALFYDLENSKVLDYVEGQRDLNARLIQTVGDAKQRFEEDHLRILRAARFSAQLNFVIAADTLLAMKALREKVLTVSGERLREEMTKLLLSKNPERGLKTLKDTEILHVLFPFRERDNAWSEFPTTESWQKWSLFFKNANAEELEKSFTTLKFSNKDRKAIEDAWHLWADPQAFFAERLGVQVQKYENPGIAFALEVLKSHAYHAEVEKLKSWRQSFGEKLPSGFLTGEDVRHSLKGESIGRCLQTAYVMQLEGQLNSKEDALQWLQKSLQQGMFHD